MHTIELDMENFSTQIDDTIAAMPWNINTIRMEIIQKLRANRPQQAPINVAPQAAFIRPAAPQANAQQDNRRSHPYLRHN